MRGGLLAVVFLGAACEARTLAPEGQAPADASRPAGGATQTTTGGEGGAGAAGIPAPSGAGLGAAPAVKAPASTSAACGLRVVSSGSQRLAPAAPGQRYLRCGSVGSDAPWRVTISPDGAYIAARTGLGTVRLLVTDGWREVIEIVSPIGRLDAAAFSPDGTQLAVMSAEAGEITLWSVRDGGLLRTLAGPPGPTIDRGRRRSRFRRTAAGWRRRWGRSSTSRAATSIQWTQVVRNRSAAAALRAGGESAGAVRRHVGPRDALHRRRRDVVRARSAYRIGNSPPTVRIAAYDATTGGGRVFYEAYGRDLFGYALSPDGTRLAISTYDYASLGQQQVLRVLRTATGELVNSGTFSGSVFAFTADGARVLVNDGVVDVRDVESLESIGRYALPAQADAARRCCPPGSWSRRPPRPTFWLNPLTGVVLRQHPFPTTEVASSADGRSEHPDRRHRGAVSRVDAGRAARRLRAGRAADLRQRLAGGVQGAADDVGTSKTLPVVGGATIYDAAVSPDGALIAGIIHDANGGDTRFGVWRLADASGPVADGGRQQRRAGVVLVRRRCGRGAAVRDCTRTRPTTTRSTCGARRTATCCASMARTCAPSRRRPTAACSRRAKAGVWRCGAGESAGLNAARVSAPRRRAPGRR